MSVSSDHIQDSYKFAGKTYHLSPKDLFVPPDALLVMLDEFAGPLDVLLYLIRKQNLDILNIPVTLVTKQYLHYIEWMDENRRELAAEYLVMAAFLIELKSKLLMPVIKEEESEEDPRMELVRQLQLYETFKNCAMWLDSLPRQERDVFVVSMDTSFLSASRQYMDISLLELQHIMRQLISKEAYFLHHQIRLEASHLSVEERMSYILSRLNQDICVAFETLYELNEGRMGVIVSFLAVLELTKKTLLSLTQMSLYGPILLEGILHE